MAYTVYEELQLRNPKSIQYYPEEYDYPAEYNKIPSIKPTFFPIQNAAKKSKKNTSSLNPTNEKKCPIYVHQYKTPNSSTYNNYSSLKTLNKNSAEKSLSKNKKDQNSLSSKSVLDQLEESYWATWKPNKENNFNKARRIRNHEQRHNTNKAYGDTSETLVKYFATADFNTSTMSLVQNNHNDKYRQKLELISSPILYEADKYSPKLLTTNTQQIQTDGYPLILPKIEERVESGSTIIEKTDICEDNTVEDAKFEKLVLQPKTDEEALSDAEDDSKLLKHTDSLIINKKKQGEVKEHFQQPKCIKLYKKPGTSTSFIRGGSYPLKSCLKREPIQRGNFKLGAPGSPILVTTSSYSRKTRK